MDLLNDNPVCFLKGDEFLPKEGITFAQQVTTYFETQGGIANSPFGIVILDKKGVQNSKQHGNSRIKSASFAAVKDVLENGIVIMPLDYYCTNDKKEMTGMIAAPIQIGDEKYVCVVEVIANLEQQRLYLHESFLTKNLQEVVASNSVHGSTASSPQPNGEVAKVLHNYLISKQNSENNKENINCNRNMNKNRIRLTESQLHKVIKESVRKVLNEINWRTKYSYMKKRKKQIDALSAQAYEIAKNKVGHREINNDEFSQYWIEAMNDLLKDPKNKKIINATQLNSDDINRAIAKQYGIGFADYRNGLVGDNQVALFQGMRGIGQYIDNGSCRKVYPDDRDPCIKKDVDDPNPNPKMVQAYNDIMSLRHKTTSDYSTLNFDEY